MSTRAMWAAGAIALAGGASSVRADEIPIITLTDVGPNQDVPTDHAFFVTGDAAAAVDVVQAIVVRKGSPSMFGDDGPTCRDVVAGLHLDAQTKSAADDDEGDEEDVAAFVPARYPAGHHRAFELFAHTEPDLHDTDVLASAAWQRADDTSRQYKVLVPHDGEFFSTGYAYCMIVVATERVQQLEEPTINELVDRVARDIVGCGDKSSCDDDALADFETRAARELATARSLAAMTPGTAKTVASAMKEAARVELASATGIVEARDRLQDHWHEQTKVMTPLAQVVWADPATEPLAHALATMLARSAALLPQVRGDKRGTAVELYSTDGKLRVGALQILDDGRTIRVAASKTPSGDQARVLTATTDTLAIGNGLTVYDLIELGAGRVHVDKEWIALTALGERLSGVALEAWTADDAAFLVAANAQLHRLGDFVDVATSGARCPHGALDASEADQTTDAVRRHLGEWLVCQHVHVEALDGLVEQLDELVREDQAWQASKAKLAARTKRIVTLTTTAPIATRVSFAARTWAFSYITPIVGYAGIVRPEDSFGLFYFGAQVHFDPNPVDDVLWRGGVTPKDLRRAVAIELGVAPYTSTFGTDRRYQGVGGLPPIFLGLAVHVVPYTSITVGGTVLDRRDSSLVQEMPHAIFAPYVGFTVQLNLPDLLRQAARPSTDTTATR